jgi:multidrug efflux system outer membrane protein
MATRTPAPMPTPTTVRARERMRCALVTFSCAGLLAACGVGPNFTRPTAQVPAHWPQPPSETGAAPPAGPSIVDEQAAELREWWSDFNDPTLDSLVSRALNANLDLRAAVLRIEESRVQRDITAAGRWPTLSASASYSRQRLSENTPTGSLFSSVGNVKLPGGAGISIPNPYSQYQLSADASWEIDLFGRLRRSVEAADANVQVSVEDQRAVRVSLVSDVAESYLALRGAQARLQVAKDDLAIIDELLDLTCQRHAAGLTTDLDVSNAMAQASATRADLPSYELQITQSINQLSQLLAREPEALRAELGSAVPLSAVPPTIPIGVPADLARRRPDIREAEASLHAATAQIGVAVANLYPRLTLSANGGFQSETAGKLLEWASRFGSLGPTLELPIFDRGRWRTVHLNDVRSQEAAIVYQRTVLNALHEVDNALSAYGADQQRRAWLDATVAQNHDALALARQRYEGGISTFIDVLDAERTLQQNELSRTASVTAVATDLVRVHRALGGGWQSGTDDGRTAASAEGRPSGR